MHQVMPLNWQPSLIQEYPIELSFDNQASNNINRGGRRGYKKSMRYSRMKAKSVRVVIDNLKFLIVSNYYVIFKK